jgi:hypothetical protein
LERKNNTQNPCKFDPHENTQNKILNIAKEHFIYNVAYEMTQINEN